MKNTDIDMTTTTTNTTVITSPVRPKYDDKSIYLNLPFPFDPFAGLGVGDLQRYLDDPMSDPDVRRDEETRATTVEHIKLLRNRLEATTKGHMMELRSYLVQATEELSRNVEGAATVGGSEGRGGGLEDMLRATFGELDRKFDSRTAKLEEKIAALIEDRLGVVARKLDLVIRKPAE